MYNLGNHFLLDKNKFMTHPRHVFQGTKYRISVLSESLVRLEYSDNGVFVNGLTPIVRNRLFDDPTYMRKEDNNFLNIETKYFNLSYVKNTKFSDKTLNVKLNGTNIVWYYGTKEVKNFGGTTYNLDGVTSLPSLEKGLFSPDGFVTIDDSKSPIIDEYNNIYANNHKHIDIYLFMYNKDFGQCLKDYWTLTGYPPMIPRYALGNWWSKDFAYDQNTINELLDKFGYANIPLSVLLLDNDWALTDKQKYPNVNCGWTFNSNLFPNPKQMIDDIHHRNIKFGLKVNPSFGFYPFEQYYEIAKKYASPNEKGIIEFNPYDARLMDLYLKIFLHPLEALGVDLFWNDYNSNDKNALFILNDIMYKDSIRNNRRGLILARSSNLASHRYPVLYSGKNCIDWNVLKMLPYFNLTSSNIGVSWWSHDVAGSMGGIEDSNFYLRSIQFSVFSPILRFNVEKGRYYKREPWKWDIVTCNIATYYLQLRHKLIPYIYSELYKYHKNGQNLIRPLYYYKMSLYDDPIYVNQYMFGDSLMISPIINPIDPIIERTIQKFYMPGGVWYDFKNGKRFLGDHKYISFYKIEDYPIFAKAGSIIPLAGESCYKSTNIPTELEIHIFPGKNNNYHLYEDDGISYEYEQGRYLITEIDYNYRMSNYTVIIRGIEGDKSIVPPQRTYRIVFRNTKKADNVVVYENAKEIPCETITTETDFIVIVKDFNTKNQLVVNCYGKNIEIDALMLIKDDVESILSDLKINTKLKDNIADIIFSDLNLSKKRIAIKKLKRKGLDSRNIKIFLKLVEYMEL